MAQGITKKTTKASAKKVAKAKAADVPENGKDAFVKKESTTVKVAEAKGRPMLHWVGKKPIDSVRSYPAQLVETFSAENKSYAEPNLLFHGDNKEVLAYLLANGYRGKVNLIYIDPPFDSKADYIRSVELRGNKTPTALQGEAQSIIEQKQYSDIWANDTYLQFMYERLLLLKELLADGGAIFLHCDSKKGHFLRCIMDEVFGSEKFVNEIVWSYKRWPSTTNAFQSMHDTILYYVIERQKKRTFNRQYEGASESYLKRFGGKTQKLDEETGTRKITLDDETKGMPLRDVWDISIIAGFKGERTSYPTQKPEELVARIVEVCSNPNDLVLDCFIGSGTTAAIAQKLGRRWIGCDINKGAIQTTSKRLQKLLSEQNNKSRQGKFDSEGEELRGEPILAFNHYRINDYDLQIQHNEALELALEHIGVTRTRTDSFFEGLLGKKLVKVVPLVHPCTLLDIELVDAELRSRHDEDRNVVMVALGKDANVDAYLVARNKKHPVNKIELIELRTDAKYGNFFTHQSAWAKVSLKREGKKLNVAIEDFSSPTILQRLSMDETIFKERIADFRSMIDVVLIDTDYNGEVFNIHFSDVPEKKADLVKGRYELEIKSGKQTVAIKVIDMLGEEVMITKEV